MELRDQVYLIGMMKCRHRRWSEILDSVIAEFAKAIALHQGGSTISPRQKVLQEELGEYLGADFMPKLAKEIARSGIRLGDVSKDVGTVLTTRSAASAAVTGTTVASAIFGNDTDADVGNGRDWTATSALRAPSLFATFASSCFPCLAPTDEQ